MRARSLAKTSAAGPRREEAACDNRSEASPQTVNKLGEKSRNAEDNRSFLGNNRDRGRFRLRVAASSAEIGQRLSRRARRGSFKWHINLSLMRSMRSSRRRALSVCPARWQGDVEPEAQSGDAGARGLSFGVGWRPCDGGGNASAAARARQGKRETGRGGEPSVSADRGRDNARTNSRTIRACRSGCD